MWVLIGIAPPAPKPRTLELSTRVTVHANGYKDAFARNRIPCLTGPAIRNW